MDWCIRDWILIWIAVVISILVLVIVIALYSVNSTMNTVTSGIQRPLNAVGQMVTNMANRANDSFARLGDGHIDNMRDHIYGAVQHGHKMVTNIEPTMLNNVLKASCNCMTRMNPNVSFEVRMNDGSGYNYDTQNSNNSNAGYSHSNTIPNVCSNNSNTSYSAYSQPSSISPPYRSSTISSSSHDNIEPSSSGICSSSNVPSSYDSKTSDVISSTSNNDITSDNTYDDKKHRRYPRGPKSQ